MHIETDRISLSRAFAYLVSLTLGFAGIIMIIFGAQPRNPITWVFVGMVPLFAGALIAIYLLLKIPLGLLEEQFLEDLASENAGGSQ